MKNWKRLFAGILATSMLWTVPGLPVAAQSLEWQLLSDNAAVQADESTSKIVSYLDENGQMQTVEAMPLPKSGFPKLTEGWYIAEGTDFDRYTSYNINDDIKLILADGCKIELVNGISVSQFMGGKLTIYAQSENPDTMGELTINTELYAAIGNNSQAGDITINGGKITASTTGDAAAIGSGAGKSGGNITINGGIITATMTSESGVAGGGAAIGGGPSKGGSSSNGGDGGNITINGGTVTAIATSGGAGIGGGGGSGTSNGGNGGNITITGGTVYAESTNGGAGIGGGSGSNSGAGGNSGNIRITGGEVTAISSAVKIGLKATYQGAGIGSGHSGKVTENTGTIEISGGKVTATGGGNSVQSGAGIGGGYKTSGGTIIISGGTVMATRGYPANVTYTDIGAGSGASGANIQISGGSVFSSTGHALMSDLPTNGGGTPVYSTMADLSVVYGSDKPVTDAVVDGYSYSFRDVYTGANGKIYMYLPEGTASANFNGSEYDGIVSVSGSNELKKVGLTLKAEVTDVTPTTAVLDVTATPDSTVYYIESDNILDTPEDVKNAAGNQKIVVDTTGFCQIPLDNLVQGEEYHYYLVAELGTKVSEVESVVVTPAAISLENARVELSKTEFIYNGTEFKPEVLVYLDDVLLKEGTDYTISYNNSNGEAEDTVHAGTITVTVTGTGKYSGTIAEQPTYVIAQKQVTAQIQGRVSKVYDGSTDITNTDELNIVVQDLVANDEVIATAESYDYQTADVGESKVVIAHNVMLSGKDADNYCLTGEISGTVGSITKSTPGFEFNPYGEKFYDGNPMPLPTESELFVTNGGRYQDVIFQWYMADGITLLGSAPVNAGEYILEVSLKATDNTNESSAKHSIIIKKDIYSGAQNVNGFVLANTSGSIGLPPLPEGAVYGDPTTTESHTLENLRVENGVLYYTGTSQITTGQSYFVNVPVSGAKNYQDYTVLVSLMAKDAELISVNMDNIRLDDKIYDGQPLQYTGEAYAEGYNGLFTYEWYDAQGKLMESAPVNAGSYILRATAAASDVAGTGEKNVVIQQAPVIIKADNKAIYINNQLPELTYTVSGLIAGDSLVQQPTILCSADTAQPGEYVITVSGADAGSNYSISYKTGVLTVLQSSGGITPPSPTPDPDPIPLPDPTPTPNPDPDPIPANSKWVKDQNGWRYYTSAGSYLTDEWKYLDSDRGYYAWYRFDRNGYVVTGWQKVDSVWYYMNDFGEMQTGWQLVDGKWYYLSGSGAMQTGWQLVDGKWYYLSGSGAMKTGWQLVDGKWYYLSGSGAMKTGWQLIDGKWYYLSGSGAMKTGWLLDQNKWYYLNDDGSMHHGWLQWSGNWYYFDTVSGSMWVDTVTPDGCYVNKNGEWVR